MLDISGRVKKFVEYANTLAGDEKGEAQVFCDRLFQAFGHDGYKEAGATLEFRVKGKKSKGTKFADLMWKPRLLLEMKKSGEDLKKHYRQAFEYWLHAVPKRPRYVVLCNFREFWIYDFDCQIDEPMDVVALDDLPTRYNALSFLLPEEKRPLFRNDLVAVTREAADKVAQVFNSLVARGEDRQRTQRFVLQCVFCLFAEDFELLPRALFTELIQDCLDNRGKTYDLFGALFKQMNSRKPASGGRFAEVKYFNGGIFSLVDPLDLNSAELELLREAADSDWSKVNPAIFGTLFQHSMDKKERHALGAHYTSEADILRVVLPTITRPWQERIDAAKTLKDLTQLHIDISKFKVLDPACGSGNFLYVAYKELKRIQLHIMARLNTEFKSAARLVGTTSTVSTYQFYGIDLNSFGVELAKVTLTLAKEVAIREADKILTSWSDITLDFDHALPLENLDANIRCDDALFCDWPKVDAIIGNPPYQSKNKMQQEYGRAYLNKLRNKYPEVPGRADYCVYWFRRAHNALPDGGRAGLVGTKTVRENYSRIGGLDYILENNGTIVEAVSKQVWPGEAGVHVSIVNWIKGLLRGRKKLFLQLGDSAESPWKVAELDHINASLSFELDVATAKELRVNSLNKAYFQGQTHGHAAFLLTPDEARCEIRRDSKSATVLHPYLIGEELVNTYPVSPQRFVIDFFGIDVATASTYKRLFSRLEQRVLPDRERAANTESQRNALATSENPRARVNKHHSNFLRRWWVLSYPRPELLKRLSSLHRYIACSRITKRPIFEFVNSGIHPNDKVQVFAYEDDYAFGVISSIFHWKWFVAKATLLCQTPNYNAKSIWDTFPWPQIDTSSFVIKVAEAAVELRKTRSNLAQATTSCYRDLYRTLDLPGDNPLRDAHEALDKAVREAYGMSEGQDPLQFLLDLNLDCNAAEKKGQEIVGPGLPPCVKDPKPFITDDCIKMP